MVLCLWRGSYNHTETPAHKGRAVASRKNGLWMKKHQQNSHFFFFAFSNLPFCVCVCWEMHSVCLEAESHPSVMRKSLHYNTTHLVTTLSSLSLLFCPVWIRLSCQVLGDWTHSTCPPQMHRLTTQSGRMNQRHAWTASCRRTVVLWRMCRTGTSGVQLLETGHNA